MKNWMLIVGPLLAAASGVVAWSLCDSMQVAWTAGITVLVAFWWISEPIPIPATSLIPIAMFPMVGVTFLTEVTSNTATTQLLLPILATAAVAAEVDPRLFMVPATISASFAFMLPVATPPNAIVFGSEQFSVRDMVREGLALNLFGVVIVTGLCYLLSSYADHRPQSPRGGKLTCLA